MGIQMFLMSHSHDAGGRLVIALAAALLGAEAWAEEPVYATPSPPSTAPFVERVKQRIPPLRHPRGDRWPMILWESLPREPQPLDHYRTLIERGLTQPIRMDTNDIPIAIRLQEVGSPVIMMQGAGGNWPASLAPGWEHDFVEGYKPEGRTRACLSQYDGWAIQAGHVRATLQAFRHAGVTVHAVWMDWEGDPWSMWMQFEQARHCRRCQQKLPRWALATPEACSAYSYRLYLRLLDTYLAAPVLEVFPRALITNWMTVFSSAEHPVLYWSNDRVPPGMPGVMNASNPVAYGNNLFWVRSWRDEFPLTRDRIDRFYMHLMLRMVSADTANRLRFRPECKSIPWVARWCPDVDDKGRLPVMSRRAYREALRHLWLRGVDGMQIFNATRPGYDDEVFAEVEDAVAVYDEMLEFADFLTHGSVLNTTVPEITDEGALWSGLRLGDQALVRAVTQGAEEATVAIQVWPGCRTALTARPVGRTFRLHRAPEGVAVEIIPSREGFSSPVDDPDLRVQKPAP